MSWPKSTYKHKHKHACKPFIGSVQVIATCAATHTHIHTYIYIYTHSILTACKGRTIQEPACTVYFNAVRFCAESCVMRLHVGLEFSSTFRWGLRRWVGTRIANAHPYLYKRWTWSSTCTPGQAGELPIFISSKGMSVAKVVGQVLSRFKRCEQKSVSRRLVASEVGGANPYLSTG